MKNVLIWWMLFSSKILMVFDGFLKGKYLVKDFLRIDFSMMCIFIWKKICWNCILVDLCFRFLNVWYKEKIFLLVCKIVEVWVIKVML